MDVPAHLVPDNCPKCVTTTRSVTVLPRSTRLYGDMIRAAYRCDCGYAWITSWSARALGVDVIPGLVPVGVLVEDFIASLRRHKSA